MGIIIKVTHKPTMQHKKICWKLLSNWDSYLCLSSCHSAMCFPGWASTSFQCLNSSPAPCDERDMLPSSLLVAERCSLDTQTVMTAFWTDEGSRVHVRASLKMGEQLSDFRFVLSLPMTLSPMVTCILAWGSVRIIAEWLLMPRIDKPNTFSITNKYQILYNVQSYSSGIM